MAALGSMEWLEDLEDERRRRFRSALIGSAVAHVLAVALLVIAPEPSPMALPQAITVDLVAALPAPPAPSPQKPAPAPVAPPPPKPEPKVKILPKTAPTPTARPKPQPKPPPKKEPVKRRPRPEELSYEDALAKLRGDLGEQAPPPTPVAKAEPTPAPAAPTARSGPGVPVPPEVAAWNLAVMRHIRSNWPMPPEFRDSGLAVQLQINVAADGRVVGEPKTQRSSGNPYFDDNAIRAVAKASPLPAPPKAGSRILIFTSEE